MSHDKSPSEANLKFFLKGEISIPLAKLLFKLLIFLQLLFLINLSNYTFGSYAEGEGAGEGYEAGKALTRSSWDGG